MMFEKTIQAMYDNYPEFFKDRADCLNHLFCVLGNGWDWKNGQLVSHWETKKKLKAKDLKARFVDGKAYQHNLMSQLDDAVSFTYRGLLDYELRDKEIPKSAHEKMKQILREHYIAQGYSATVYHDKPRAERWYFAQCNNWCEDYVPLFNIPDDIRPDWKKGLEECLAMIREDGYNPDDLSKRPIDE